MTSAHGNNEVSERSHLLEVEGGELDSTVLTQHTPPGCSGKHRRERVIREGSSRQGSVLKALRWSWDHTRARLSSYSQKGTDYNYPTSTVHNLNLKPCIEGLEAYDFSAHT